MPYLPPPQFNRDEMSDVSTKALGLSAGARTPIRFGAWAGLGGPVLFVAVFVIEGWLRLGYASSRMYVSALSYGPFGWIQIANFVVVGLCFLLLSKSTAVQFRDGKASRAGPVLLAIVGLGLLGSGPFVMDPAGTPFPQMSTHGQVHAILGALVFSLGPASCFVFFRRFRADPTWGSFRWWTLAAGILMTTAVILLKVATLPPPASPNALSEWVGVLQRIIIVPLMAWAACLAGRMLWVAQRE